MQIYYKIPDEKDIAYVTSVVGAENILADEENKRIYGSDYTGEFYFEPAFAVKPGNTEEISKIVRYCNENRIAITPRGAGTSLSAATIPVEGGIVLSLERLNKIIEIDERNLQATVEPGVINEVLQQAVIAKGLFYPPDPASKGSCFLGGNVAHSSGGPKAVKYGTTKEYILNLEVVLPNGEIIMTGANTLKNSTGYNLTQLMVGSEGTLGIVTKIVVKLIPYPAHRLLMMAFFESIDKACTSVAAIFHKGITPSALEFVERAAWDHTMGYTGNSMTLPGWAQALLIIEVDGNYLDSLQKDCESIYATLEENGCGDVLYAESDFEKEQIWAIRRKVGEAVKSISAFREEDATVPRAELPKLLHEVKAIGTKYNFRSFCYGHAGDGNVHINILRDSLSDEAWETVIHTGAKEIFEVCKRLKGTISGEHGIGYVQKEYMGIIFPEEQINLMKRIKAAFDPNGIMNPGKIF